MKSEHAPRLPFVAKGAASPDPLHRLPGNKNPQRASVLVEAALSLLLMITILSGIVSFGTFFCEYQRFSRAVSAATAEFARFQTARLSGQSGTEGADPVSPDALVELIAEQLGEPLPSSPRTGTQIDELKNRLGVTVVARYYPLDLQTAGQQLVTLSSTTLLNSPTTLLNRPVYLTVTATRRASAALPISGIFGRYLPNITSTASFLRAGATISSS